MRLTILESPYAGTEEEIAQNVEYARRCLRDCLLRGESAIASHLLWTQQGVLRDDVPAERQAGIAAGLAWYQAASASAVYTDRGITKGMREGISAAERWGVPVEYRTIGG